MASSKITRSGFRRIALVMAMRCFSLPESFIPRSPTSESYLSLSLLIKTSAWASLAAFRRSLSLASGEAKRKFAAILSLKAQYLA